ncbi:DUF368 domain-containing protein [Gemmiger formicilis]|uniref:DUF368 domain-containing protein n=1 Tax=Gemmiger formicilis TaxID=745368 RepID=UPI00195A9085|nr:DUF368 domain-containing protein [Gemmiger formicilis]MBM6715294.1 DUF368 domain-containing protein [Gemmiger formicilis]
MKENRPNVLRLVLRLLQGMLIGVGAVLPGISGGVLCVVFGIYKPVMELLGDPLHKFRTHVPKLLPVIAGAAVGFLGVAKILAFFLETYPAPSVCLFIGLITGMLPSLFREAGEQGRPKGCGAALGIAFALILGLLIGLNLFSVVITPNFGWYLFCGFCLALSVIAPGMSFSTLLMPLGLYTPFVDGLGSLKLGILIPAGIGAVITVICLARAVDTLFDRFYPYAFHAIIGVVLAATLMIVPFDSFTVSAASAVVNVVCLAVGVLAALALDRFNSRVPKQDD